MNQNKNDIFLAIDYSHSEARMMVASKNNDGKLHIEGYEKEAIKDNNVISYFKSQLRKFVNRTKAKEFVSCFRAYECRSMRIDLTKRIHISRDISGVITRQDLDSMSTECAEMIADGTFNIRSLEVLPLSYMVDNKEVMTEPIGETCDRLIVEYVAIQGKSNQISSLEIDKDHSVDMHYKALPVIMTDYLLPKDLKEKGCMMIDFGEHLTTMMVYYNGRLRHTVTIPFGGAAVTKDIATKLNLSLNDAEIYKVKYGSADVESVTRESIRLGRQEFTTDTMARIIEARENEILDYVWRELEDLKCQSELRGGVILSGGASEMRGLKRLIEKRGLSAESIDLSVVLDSESMRYKNPSYAHIISLLCFADVNCAKFNEVTPTVDETEEQRQREEAQRRAEEEARRQAEEEARRQAEEEARRQAEEEARRQAEEEARRAKEKERKKLGFFDKIKQKANDFFDDSATNE